MQTQGQLNVSHMIWNKPRSAEHIKHVCFCLGSVVMLQTTRKLRYTIEFGVIREGKAVKAFGAGVLSSYGELEHMASGRPTFLPFDPFKPQVGV